MTATTEKKAYVAARSRRKICRLLVGRGVDDRDRIQADARGDTVQQDVLGGEVTLHLRHLCRVAQN
jgi:hypothetical protein